MIVSKTHFQSQSDTLPRSGPFARLPKFVLAAILIVVALAPAFAEPDPPTLRIGLVRYLKGAPMVNISCSVDFVATGLKGRDKLTASTYLEPIEVFPRKDGLEIKRADGRSVMSRDDIRVAPAKPGGLLTISAAARAFSQYRGVLEIRRVSENALMVVNVVPLEDYLQGVLPAEMPASFRPEALKSQAIAARTYAEHSRGRHKSTQYDLCDSYHCQVYLGSGGEKQTTSRAVTDTCGLVMRYKGDLISAVYSADCGGCTQTGDDAAMSQPEPYLRSIPDCPEVGKPDFCSVNKTHEWSKAFTPEELETALNAGLKPPLEGLKSLAFVQYDDSGRVRRVDITDGKGVRSITGAELRKICGPSVIRSVKMIVCTTDDGKICFEGKGWGHGVGLCQWGAEGIARPPWNYTSEQILKRYYPGVEIVRLK